MTAVGGGGAGLQELAALTVMMFEWFSPSLTPRPRA
jgi:hypothetical protein